jgi:hypothetical protein
VAFPKTAAGEKGSWLSFRKRDFSAIVQNSVILALSMADLPSVVGREYSSRSEGNRRLLAVTFAALLIATASHIASYFGFVVIQSRPLQDLLTWILAPLALWQILFRGALNAIPRRWRILVFLAWLNASILGQFLPVAGDSYMWPRVMHWFGQDRGSPLLFKARASSAGQLAAALSLFLTLWYRSSGRDAASPEKTDLTWSPGLRRLAVYGIALPMGIVVAYSIFRGGNWGLDSIGWIGIIAAFWWIAGMIVTGIYLLRDALRRDR